MKKKQIKLQKLKVSSFLTTLETEDQITLKGGDTFDYTITLTILPPATNPDVCPEKKSLEAYCIE